jgi:hypothetical protein
MTHTLPIRVYYEDTDMAGIVYYANYLRYIERARSDWVREIGIDQLEMFSTICLRCGHGRRPSGLRAWRWPRRSGAAIRCCFAPQSRLCVSAPAGNRADCQRNFAQSLCDARIDAIILAIDIALG